MKEKYWQLNQCEVTLGTILNVEEVKIMFKKVFGAVMALAFVFGIAAQSNIVSSGSDVSSYACCEHDGDVWSW